MTNDLTGEFTLYLTKEVTANLQPRTYKCDVEFIMLDGETVSSKTFDVIVERDYTYHA